MKICCGCREEKSDCEFYDYMCRSCMKLYRRKYYELHKESHKKACILRQSVCRSGHVKNIKLIKDHIGCQLCGEAKSCCLDFHHIGGKQMDISRIVNFKSNWSEVLREIVKCILVCVNCHRKLHCGILCSPIVSLECYIDDLYPGWRDSLGKVKIKFFQCKYCGISSESEIRRNYCSIECFRNSCRKVIVSEEQLRDDLLKYNWSEIGRKYNVSCNAVRKWARRYNLCKLSSVDKNKIKLNEFKKYFGCQLCGEVGSCCLDFHHIKNKEYLVSYMVGRGMSWFKVLSEIAKCTILCANCHRKVHGGILFCPVVTLGDRIVELYPEFV